MQLFLRQGLLFLTLLCFYAASYNALLNYRSTPSNIAQHSRRWASLPPLVLQALAGEFKGLLADLIVLDIGAQLGTELVRDPSGGFRTVKKQYDWQNISHLFFTSQALDPSFQQTYILAQGWLPWEPAGMLAETEKILTTATKNRPWDWQPNHTLGFNAYYFSNNPGKAGKLFLAAANTPKAPPFLAILGARLAQKGGETETAIVIMKSMLADKAHDEPGYNDMVDRLHALEGILILERASQQYEKSFEQKPTSLEQLVTSGILAALPENPYNLPYCIDTEGVIYFDNPQCRASSTGTEKTSR
ncbi:MAG: hypothetical protein KKD63_03370 [Proteobacteria bacterium]|nr:hypothetical protein [Desulfobulbaceae bacterium]MBU4151899.1 hypothetical protein [Pseudomonadota bacterium]MDP2107397.1 hypothetical protein [Desulfobulbaceae bacterium]